MTFEIILENRNLEGVGEVEISWDLDSDEYKEWLNENLYENDYSTLLEYVKSFVTFDIEYFDNETYHHMGFETVDFEELEDIFGNIKVKEIINELNNEGTSKFETLELYNSEEYNVNNPNELNAISMKILNHGEYYKDCRGFILSNGVVIYTPAEHNLVSQINGVKNTFDFIRLGNIRVLHQSIDLCKRPTPEQRDVLRKVIASYSNEELYLDIFGENGGEIGCHYVKPDYRYVMGEIDRYFNDGIKPQGNTYYESVKKKCLIISESQYNRLFTGFPKMCGSADSAALYINGINVADYYYLDKTAYPFIIHNDKLYIGEKSETHGQVSWNIVGYNIENSLNGRIWVSPKTNDFNYSVVLFWGDTKSSENCKGKIYELADKLNVNPNKIMIGITTDDGYISMTPLNEWDGFVHKISEKEQELRNLHLMNPKDKLNNTDKFRKSRDKKLGEKLTNNKGEEMPMAKYHNLIYQESKNIKINNEQYKRLFEQC